MTCRGEGDVGDSVGTVEATGSLQLPLLLVLQGLGSSTLACLGVDNIVVVMMEMMLENILVLLLGSVLCQELRRMSFLLHNTLQ